VRARSGEGAERSGRRARPIHLTDMNSEYVWWVIVLILVGAGAIAFLTLGRIPEIEDEPEPDIPDQVEADPHTAS